MGDLVAGLFGGVGGALAQHPWHNREVWDLQMPQGYMHVSDTREYDVARAQQMAFEEAGWREVNEIAPSDT